MKLSIYLEKGGREKVEGERSKVWGVRYRVEGRAGYFLYNIFFAIDCFIFQPGLCIRLRGRQNYFPTKLL